MTQKNQIKKISLPRMTQAEFINFWLANEQKIKAIIYNTIATYDSPHINLDDTYQNTFETGLKYPHYFTHQYFFRRLKQVAKNTIARELRHIRKFRATAPIDMQGYEHHKTLKRIPNIADMATIRLDLSIALDDNEKQLYQYITSGYTQNEISEKVGLTRQTAQRRIYSLKNKIKDYIDVEFG